MCVMRMKLLAYGTVALLALLLSFPAAGQGIGTFKARLARPGESTDAVVTVREYGSAVEAVRRYDNSDRPTEIPGYRIRIFSITDRMPAARHWLRRSVSAASFPVYQPFSFTKILPIS